MAEKSPILVLPEDKIRVEQLQKKLEEYKQRVDFLLILIYNDFVRDCISAARYFFYQKPQKHGNSQYRNYRSRRPRKNYSY